METKEVLLSVQSLLALKLDISTERLRVDPSAFVNGYRGGVTDCLEVVNELLEAVSDKVSAVTTDNLSATG
jgi:hypothetical protein